jgi:acyl dehydratase
MNKSTVGKVYRPAQTYQVGREGIGDFARAIGDANPLYLDPAAARAAGYADVIAPPTFLTAVGNRFEADNPMFDPEVEVDFSRIVHSEQRFELARPVTAGDELSVTVTITQIKDVSVHELLAWETTFHDQEGALVATAFGSVISRETAAPKTERGV